MYTGISDSDNRAVMGMDLCSQLADNQRVSAVSSFNDVRVVPVGLPPSTSWRNATSRDSGILPSRQPSDFGP